MIVRLFDHHHFFARKFHPLTIVLGKVHGPQQIKWQYRLPNDLLGELKFLYRDYPLTETINSDNAAISEGETVISY